MVNVDQSRPVLNWVNLVLLGQRTKGLYGLLSGRKTPKFHILWLTVADISGVFSAADVLRNKWLKLILGFCDCGQLRKLNNFTI